MWVVLYAIEAVAIMSVLKTHPNDNESAVRNINSKSLLRKMFPAELTSISGFKQALLSITNRHTLTPSTAAAEAITVDVQTMPAASEPLATASAAVATPEVEVLPDTNTQGLGRQALNRSLEKALNGAEAKPKVRELLPGITKKRQQDGVSKRDQELLDRKSYLKNFWYAAGKLTLGTTLGHVCLSSSDCLCGPIWYCQRQGTAVIDVQSDVSVTLAYEGSHYCGVLPACLLVTAALSEAVKDKPVGVDILDTRIVLFRDESGVVRCLDDACPHRGAPLSDGWVATDKETGHSCVVCPYHGWAFDAEGKLRDVPSADKGTWPKRPIINNYPVSVIACGIRAKPG